MRIEPITDLSRFGGVRVVINGVRAARITKIHHGSLTGIAELEGGVGGECMEDPHGDCKGGWTSFWWPYGTDLEVAS